MNPINITVNHPSTVSAADVLGVINSEVDATAPVIVQALPQTPGNQRISLYVTAGEIGLSILTQIFQGIQAKHQAALAAQNQAAAQAAAQQTEAAPKPAGII